MRSGAAVIGEIKPPPADAAEGEAAPAGAHAALTPTDCLNCGARLYGRHCHVCGQGADDHHRAIGHLVWEMIEGFTHLDGRLARTLPALLFRPGRSPAITWKAAASATYRPSASSWSPC